MYLIVQASSRNNVCRLQICDTAKDYFLHFLPFAGYVYSILEEAKLGTKRCPEEVCRADFLWASTWFWWCREWMWKECPAG